MTRVGDELYAGGQAGMEIVDVSMPTAPRRAGVYQERVLREFDGLHWRVRAEDIVVRTEEGIVVLAAEWAGLRLIRRSTP